MRIGVVGSRNFTDESLMDDALDRIVQRRAPLVDTIVSGGAEGADSMAAKWSKDVLGQPAIEHLPDFDKYGSPRAFFERNTTIVDDVDRLVAFFGPGEPPSVNKSGTMDTVRKAIKKRIPIELHFQ